LEGSTYITHGRPFFPFRFHRALATLSFGGRVVLGWFGCSSLKRGNHPLFLTASIRRFCWMIMIHSFFCRAGVQPFGRGWAVRGWPTCEGCPPNMGAPAENLAFSRTADRDPFFNSSCSIRGLLLGRPPSCFDPWIRTFFRFHRVRSRYLAIACWFPIV